MEGQQEELGKLRAAVETKDKQVVARNTQTKRGIDVSVVLTRWDN